MRIQQERKSLCVVCKSAEIVESRALDTIPDDEVPDVGGCDYNRYHDYVVTGGRLLKNRVERGWLSAHHLSNLKLATTPGGICDRCLKTELIEALMQNIEFAPQK